MTGFTLLTLLTLLNAGDGMPMCEMRALVDAVVKRSLSIEEERLRQFWCEYQRAVREHEASNIDWVSYYKGHGYQLDPQGRVICGPMPNPIMQWAVPNSSPTGVLVGPGGVPYHVYWQMMGAYR